jgi:hypothetical protein
MIEQVQIYTSLLQLLDYQLKELLKLHIETREILNNAINASVTLTETLITPEAPYIVTPEITLDICAIIPINQTLEPTLDPVKLNDIDSDDEDDANLEKKQLITMDPLIEKTGCFMRKPKCFSPPTCVAPKCMYEILPNTLEDRQRRYKEELEEVIKKKVEGIHNKKFTLINKHVQKEKKCAIM